jgi:hypothetical protein
MKLVMRGVAIGTLLQTYRAALGFAPDHNGVSAGSDIVIHGERTDP